MDTVVETLVEARRCPLARWGWMLVDGYLWAVTGVYGAIWDR